MNEKNGPRADDGEIHITSAVLADIADVLKFYEAHLGTWQQLIKFWDWRQNLNPYRQDVNAVVARSAGEVVGCMSVSPVLVVAGGRRIGASWQQDSLVLSSMRGKGLGRKLIHEANRNSELALAKGTSRSMYALRKSSNFQDAPNANYLLRIEEARSLQDRTWEGIAEHILAQWPMLTPRPRIDGAMEVREIDTFDASFDDLAAALAQENVLRIFKDREYLNWRYRQCPGKNYKIFRAGGENARGAIVVNITGNGEGWIVDMVCSSADRKCTDALLANAIDYLKTNHVARIWVFTTLPAARKRLYRFGFIPTPKSPKFTYVWPDVASRLLTTLHWDFWHGDGDIELYM